MDSPVTTISSDQRIPFAATAAAMDLFVFLAGCSCGLHAGQTLLKLDLVPIIATALGRRVGLIAVPFAFLVRTTSAGPASCLGGDPHRHCLALAQAYRYDDLSQVYRSRAATRW